MSVHSSFEVITPNARSALDLILTYHLQSLSRGSPTRNFITIPRWMCNAVVNTVDRRFNIRYGDLGKSPIAMIYHQFGIPHIDSSGQERIIIDNCVNTDPSSDKDIPTRPLYYRIYSLPKIYICNFGGLIRTNDEHLAGWIHTYSALFRQPLNLNVYKYSRYLCSRVKPLHIGLKYLYSVDDRMGALEGSYPDLKNLKRRIILSSTNQKVTEVLNDFRNLFSLKHIPPLVDVPMALPITDDDIIKSPFLRNLESEETHFNLNRDIGKPIYVRGRAIKIVQNNVDLIMEFVKNAK